MLAMGVRYIGVKLPTGAIRHSKTRLAQTAGRGALEPRNSCSIYISRRRYAQIEPVPSFAERARRKKLSRDRARREVRVRAATD